MVTNCIHFSIIMVSPEKVLGFDLEMAFFHSEGLCRCLNSPFSAPFYPVEPGHLGSWYYREEPQIDRRP